MQIICETELMKNQTHAELMTPGGRFKALKTQEDSALFFSLGTDNILYLTREGGGSATGWSRLDLSSDIGRLHTRAITAHAFDVSQNPQSGNIDLAVVINDGTTDHLYVSQGNANSETSWSQGVTWQPVPYDDPDKARPVLKIADLYLMQTPAGDISRYFIADVVGDGELLFRYFIDPDKATYPQCWNEHYISDVQAGSVTSCMGQWPNDDVAGIYTFGQIGEIKQLQYQRTVSSELGTTGRIYKFHLPAGASAITTALDANGNSHFFVAADQTLHFYPPDQQGVLKQTGTPVINDPFFAGVTQLHAAASAGSTVVWGVNAENHLAYMKCPAGSEHDATAWSAPARILDKVVRIAPFLNTQQDNAVMFAHRSGDAAPGASFGTPAGGEAMVKFTQDPVTSAWKSRGVPLPTGALNHLVEYQSFTTHVRVTDDDNLSIANAAISVTCNSPLTIYANGASHDLSPNVPLTLQADVTGVLTIVQETDSLSGTAFDIGAAATVAGSAVAGAAGAATAAVRPMQKPVDTLRKIQSGRDLAAVKVTNSDGSVTNLVSSSTPPNDVDASAQLVKKLVGSYDNLPADGARQKVSPVPLGGDEAVAHIRRAVASGSVFGVAREAGGLVYYEGDAAAARFGLLPGVAGARDPGSFLSSLWGDVFAWLKFAWDKVESFAVTVAGKVSTFIITIGEKIYHVVADCIYAVGHAFEYAFNAIKVAFEDLVKWIGFIFNWNDIVRTHKVLKNIIRTYAQKAIDDIPKLETDIANIVSAINSRIDKWDNLAPAGTVGDQTRQSSSSGQNKPQSHWALHHMKNNLSSSTAVYTPKDASDDDGISNLANHIQAKTGAFSDATKNLKELFSGHIPGLSLADIVKAVVGVLAELIVDTAGEIIVLCLKVLKNFTDGIMDALDTAIDIPVISYVYKLISGGDPLTVLDLACLVIAIPVTIIYKIEADAAPYPAGALTDSLIAATSFAQIRSLLSPATLPGVAAAPLATGIPDKTLRATALGLNIGAFFAMFGVVITNVAKSVVPPQTPSWKLNLVAASFYLVYVAPNFMSALEPQTQWYQPLNDTVTAVSIVKTLADNITPLAKNKDWQELSSWEEMLINALWLAPPIGAMVEQPSVDNLTALTANTMFDVGGMLTPFSTRNGVIVDNVFAAMQLLSIAYGALSLEYGIFRMFPSTKKGQAEASA